MSDLEREAIEIKERGEEMVAKLKQDLKEGFGGYDTLQTLIYVLDGVECCDTAWVNCKRIAGVIK